MLLKKQQILSIVRRLVLIFLPLVSQAAVNERVNLAPFVNADLTSYTRGFAYPPTGGTIRIGDKLFYLSPEPGDFHTAVIQSLSDDALFGARIHFREGTIKPSGNESIIVIPIKKSSVNAVYVLMNSAFGQCGAVIGELQFIGGAGEIFEYLLREGQNIRDHNNAQFCNTLSEVSGVANYGNVRLDYQTIKLPPNFSGSLDRIVLRGFRQQRFAGAPFIAAITLNRNQEETDSTIKFGPVADCLPDAKTKFCTPPNSSVTALNPKSFTVVLPAHLVDGAWIPNPHDAGIRISQQTGTVCLPLYGPTNPVCMDPSAHASAAGPGFLDPHSPPGALLWRTTNGQTFFSVNGRISDEIPIANSQAREFKGYEGKIAFEIQLLEP